MKQCKHCGVNLIVKQTVKKAVQRTKPYYYSAYYYCPMCHRIYHDEKFKVINRIYDSPLLFENMEKLTGMDSSPSRSSSPVDREIWTDGACTNNGTEKAKAAWAFVSNEYEEAGLVEGKQTNNRGEAYALLYALKWAAKKGYRRIKIHTDSQISIFGVTKHFSKVKANQDIFQDIAKVITENTMIVLWQKVLGHSGDSNNERVDKLANGLASS